MTNCIFESNLGRCTKHVLPSFRGIICEKHLQDVFGLTVNVKEIHPPDVDTRIGPFLNVVRGQVFEANTVLIPTRKFIDEQLALTKSDATIDTESPEYMESNKYTLNPRLENFIRRLMSSPAHDSAMFLTEVARNMLQGDVTNMNMVLESDDVKSNVKTKVQTHLNSIQSYIRNQDYYVFCVENIIPRVSGTNVKFSPFERFMMFNMLTDETKIFSDHHLPETLQPNLQYEPDKGFVVTRKICGCIDLVLTAVLKSDPRYIRWKQRKDYKTCPSKPLIPSKLGDAQNPHNIMGRCL